MPEKQSYNHKEAADYLGIAPQTLYNWRFHRRGPDYTLMGRKPIYLKLDLDAYREKHKVVLNR
jgi:hypothetical protein